MTDKNANTEIRKEFCPNCEAETPCTHEAELFVCDICGEDFAKYIVSRKCNVSDVSMTQGVLTDVKTPLSIEMQQAEAEISRLKAERRWIPVSERLPELYKPVLCCSNYNYVFMYSLANENRHYWYNERGWAHDFDSVTHWMPLPPPPEGDK